ncbi:MAG: DoxX family protein [Deltaproteobacteria bacterium]|nr:MAG: DoxX family protein [Deltaproteobacteria bacterium]
MNTNTPWTEWLWRFLRVFLGAVFLYASIDKIIYPDRFAFAISNYRILPGDLVNFVAVWLPWLEVTVGVFLIFGLFEWASLTLYNMVMLIFLAAIAINLARGVNISCGCFSLDPNAEKMSWLTFMRDLGLLVPGLGAYILLVRRRPPPFLEKPSR